MDRDEKLKTYEKMQEAVQAEYDNITAKMEQLKNEGRVKSATYRQLMGKRMIYKDMLNMYEVYGL